MQIAETLKYAKQQLTSSDSANLDAEILLCSVLNCDRTNLYTNPDRELSNNDSKSFNKLINLRSKGHPVAHLINKKEFWSLELTISTDTLIPRPETEILVESAIKLIPTDSSLKVLDLGTGSGAIAIAIASERPLATITATDINENALTVAQRNVEKHNIKNITFKNADWLDIDNKNFYDVIVSNPPYISSDDPHLKKGDVRFEDDTALVSGKEGLDDLRVIIGSAKDYLNKEGWLLLEHGYQQGGAVRQLLTENNFNNVSTLKDYSKLERVSMGQSLS